MRQKKFYKNKNVILTGAASGLGREMAIYLNEYGANVTCIVSPTSKVETIGFTNKILRCDLGDIKKVEDLCKNPVFHNVDILINCAGVFPLKTFEETSTKEYFQTMNVNCTAPLILAKACIPAMKQKREATIINVGSSSCYNGSERTGAYCVSKHALLGMSRSLMKEVKKYNIRVLMLSPGSIKTKMGRLDPDQDIETFLDPKEVAEYFLFSATYQNEMVTNEIRVNRIETI